MMLKAILIAAALSVTAGASAGTLFSDNFNTEGPGGSQLNYAGFANFTTTGQVDLVQSGEFGITCPGRCVDLDGTSGPGSLTSKAIAFAAGKRLTVSFDLSGSQRSSASDEFNFTGNFGASTDILGFTSTNFIGAGSGDFFGLTTLGAYSESIAGTSPFKTYSLSFTPVQAGSLTLVFGTTSADNIGPLLDNISVNAVPEPASWMLMIAGFGLVGTALRTRKTSVAA